VFAGVKKKGGSKSMSRTLVIQNEWLRKGFLQSRKKNTSKTSFGKGLNMSQKAQRSAGVSGTVRMNVISLGFALAIIIFLTGAFYLYQVNSLATQGFEIKEIETQIQAAEKEGKQLKIKEVELRSMNNIEKATEELNLVNSADITYLEMAGPMAMK
jgi:hypothetical protein